MTELDIRNTLNLTESELSILYPNDFCVYICSLELVQVTPSGDSKTVNFLTFPVNPNSISEREVSDTNIMKTSGGIITLDTSTFIPISISFSGTFGRRLRMLVGRDNIDATAINFTLDDKQAIYSNQLKTGYGTTKVLQQILQQSRKTDSQGNQYKLYFYNQGFGTSYLVKYIDATYSQDLGTNMMWQYSIQLVGIAPINSSKKSVASSTTTLVGVDMIAAGISNVRESTQDILDKDNSLTLKSIQNTKSINNLNPNPSALTNKSPLDWISTV